MQFGELEKALGSPVLDYLSDLHAQYAGPQGGEVATYIPELGKANPDWFAICLVTSDGYIYEVGDTRQLFSIQSISKPFVYGIALEDNAAIRRKFDASQVSSKRLRSPRERRILSEHGYRIKIYELQGELMFAATEAVIRDIVDLSSETDFMIIDFNRVQCSRIRPDQDVECYVMFADDFEALSTTHPELKTLLLSNLLRSLSGRLRKANAEISLLSS
jgi:glutaminase